MCSRCMYQPLFIGRVCVMLLVLQKGIARRLDRKSNSFLRRNGKFMCVFALHARRTKTTLIIYTISIYIYKIHTYAHPHHSSLNLQKLSLARNAASQTASRSSPSVHYHFLKSHTLSFTNRFMFFILHTLSLLFQYTLSKTYAN